MKWLSLLTETLTIQDSVPQAEVLDSLSGIQVLFSDGLSASKVKISRTVLNVSC